MLTVTLNPKFKDPEIAKDQSQSLKVSNNSYPEVGQAREHVTPGVGGVQAH